MRTRKPISTISYNTRPFLELKLGELLLFTKRKKDELAEDSDLDSKKTRKADFWCFICHKPEDDEAGNKPHIHLYIEPTNQLETSSLQASMDEPDLRHSQLKPLKCLAFRSSKFDDWCLYSLHDKAYLASKGQSRKYHYDYSDLVASDPDELLYRYRMIDRSKLLPFQNMLDLQSQGVSFGEFIKYGRVPVPQINAWRSAWYELSGDDLNRNGRITHTPNEDEQLERLVPDSDLEIGEINLDVDLEYCARLVEEIDDQINSLIEDEAAQREFLYSIDGVAYREKL